MSAEWSSPATVHGGIRSGALVGREDEVGAVERLLDRLSARRHPRFLELQGEPGIGKTRLLEVVAEGAEARGFLVLAGRAAEFERYVPFGLVVDALDDHLATIDPTELGRLGGTVAAELARVFPSLAQLGSEVSDGLQEERYRVHRALRALLGRLARQRPLVLILDDMHWADPASVELVGYLLRRPPVARVLLVLAFRSGQVPEPLLTALHSADMERSGDRLELAPLSREAIGELLGNTVDRWTRERLRRESGGNPMYLEELAGASRRQGPCFAALPGEHGAPVPPRIARAISSELAGLPVQARVVLQSAAVIGDTFTLELVAATAGTTEAAAALGVDAALIGGLIRPGAAPRQFRFRHPIVRRAAYESASAGWRVAAHARTATALEQAGAPLVAYAHHVERSARDGDERAVKVLVAAARECAMRAPATAAHWLRSALRLLPDQAPLTIKLEILVPLATALGATGDLQAGRATLRELLGLLGPQDAYVRARVVAVIALVEHMLGEHSSATTLLLDTLKDVDPCTREAAELTYQLAWDYGYRGENEQMASQSALAQNLATALADRPLMAATSALSGLARYNLGSIEQAHEGFLAAHAIVIGLPDEELAGRLDAFLLLGWVARVVERFDDGLRHLERGLTISRATGQGSLYVPMLLGVGMIRLWQGNLAAAARMAEDAIDVARLSRNDQSLTWALSLQTWVATRAGDLALAVRAGEEAVALDSELSDHYYSTFARCVLAETRLEVGEPARCAEELLAATGGPELLPIDPPFRSHLYEILTRAALAVGDVEAADGWAGRAESAVAGVAIGSRQAEALRARAAVELARGRPKIAAPLASRSLDMAAASGNRLDAARARALYGTALASAGGRPEAVEELAVAHAELTACGAQRLADHVARDLRRLGSRVSRHGLRGTPGTGMAALSGREREVADLVATGRTNRQIASELYVSVKTVEGHLANVFAKLGVSARAAVAAQVAAQRQ